MKIGFFDSGLGGLMIMEAVRREMSQYDYYYYGDTAHVPYGDRSEDEVYELTKQGIEHLFKQDVLIAIVACNTASAETLRRLQDTFLVEWYPERRILGVIIPTVETLIESGCKKPLLIATKRTVDSNKYQNELDKVSAHHIELCSEATPTLVPYIEQKNNNGACDEVVNILRKYGELVDSVILGCTHYSVLKECVRKNFQDSFQVFSQDEIIPKKLQLYLENHSEFKSRLTRGECAQCYFTGKEHT